MSQSAGTRRVLSKLVAWASARDDLRAIAVVGSRARIDHAADEWSDLDVVLIARRPRRYLAGSEWLAEIESPWLAVLQPTPVGGQVIFHLTFAGGTKVDVVVVSSAALSLALRTLAALRRVPPLRRLLPKALRDQLGTLSDQLSRGMHPVLDKDGIAALLEAGCLPAPPPTPPSQEEFLDLVRCFFNEQVWVALKLRRGELFVAKTTGESRLTSLLLRLIEWHTQVTSEHWSPVFERGRFLDEWAPEVVLERLPGLFANYHPAEIWRARCEAADLFGWLARETANALGYAYPTQLEATVMTWFAEQARECGD